MSEPEVPAPTPSTSASSPPPFPQPRPYTPGPYNPWIADDEPPRGPTTNGFAIASLILGIVAIFPAAITLGIIALVQISDRNQRGKGLAVGGLVASGVWVALILAISMVGSSEDRADRDSTGQITEEGSVSAYSLEVGDCLNDISELEESTVIRSIPAVPCSDPHEAEVYGTFELTNGDYPGEEAVFAEADQQCSELLWDYSPEAYDDPTIGIFYLYPDEYGWSSDREVVCIAHTFEGALTGALADPLGI